MSVAACERILILYGTLDDTSLSYEVKERMYVQLSVCLTTAGLDSDIKSILAMLSPPLSTLSKEETAKMLHSCQILARVPVACQEKIELCKVLVEWCKSEKCTFAGQRCEGRLSDLLIRIGISDIKSGMVDNVDLDDKLLRLEVNLAESILHVALDHIDKANNILTRAGAEQMGTPEENVDAKSILLGIVSLKGKSFESAKSHFGSVLDHYPTKTDLPPQLLYATKYLLLSACLHLDVKSFSVLLRDVKSLKFRDGGGNDIVELESMLKIAEAYTDGNLYLFRSGMSTHKEQLKKDCIIKEFINDLYTVILEESILVKISDSMELTFDVPMFTKRIGAQCVDTVRKKLVEMTSKKTINGKLEDDSNQLILFIGPGDKRYATAHYRHDIFFAKAIICWLTTKDSDCILPVRNQGLTNTCYSFVFVDLIYSVGFLQTPSIKVKGSEQDLIDSMHHAFVYNYHVGVLGMGWDHLKVFSYVRFNGLATDEDVPFVGSCRTSSMFQKDTVEKILSDIREKKQIRRIEVKKHIILKNHSEVCNALLRSPVAASIYPCFPSFSQWKPDMPTYAGGNDFEKRRIATGEIAPRAHAVLIVGMGVDEEGQEYYMCKNSHGPESGHRGFINVVTHLCSNFRTVKEVNFVEN